MTLQINEIFYSIQGESTWAGLPFVFVRLSGCNLRCRYCDTQYAYAPGEQMQIDAILKSVASFQCPRVTLTGGEPLLQERTPELVNRLLDTGYQVTLETNGSRDIGCLDQRCIKIMDIKCPSSGVSAHHLESNQKHLSPDDQVKFVVADHADFQYALKKTKLLRNRIPAGNILFSPVHTVLSAARLAEWMLAAHVEGRLQLQMHKILWPDIPRGV